MGDTPEHSPGTWDDTPPPSPPAATEAPSPEVSPKAAPAEEEEEEHEEEDNQITRHHCAICLARHKRPAMVRSCFHMFCFECIAKWYRVGRGRCPVCKLEFDTVVTDIASDTEYTVHCFTHKDPSPQDPASQPNTGCEWRREVYARGIWARMTNSRAMEWGVTADAGKEEERLKEWVERELRTLMGTTDVELVTMIVLSTIELPEETMTQLKGLLDSDHLEHFVHELRYVPLTAPSSHGVDAGALYIQAWM